MRLHHHEGPLFIDTLAQQSRLYTVHPMFKWVVSLGLMAVCLCADKIAVGIGLTLMMMCVTVFIGGIHWHHYLSLMSMPLFFLIISGIALAFDYQAMPGDWQNLPVFGGFLVVTKSSLHRMLTVCTKALGCVSCLYFFSLSTPMAEIIGVLKRCHVPEVIISLMYLIYKYIFIMLRMHQNMKDAARSRLGYQTFSGSLKTTGQIYSHLLARSYKQAGHMFDAMESRCFDGRIAFLEEEKQLKSIHVIGAAVLFAMTIILWM